MRLPISLTALLLLILGSLSGNFQEQAPLPQSPSDVCPLMIGATIPAVTVATVDGETLDLLAVVKTKPTVLVYYRGGW